ncbi:MAG: bZIP transcription factor [Bacteroidota bacterium]
MRTKILSGLICCLGIFSANAQTITAPTGQNLTITNPVDVTGAGNTINVPSDGGFKIGGSNALNTKGTFNLFIGAFAGPSVTGQGNTFMGTAAGYATTTGNNNMFLGTNAGTANTTGNGSTFIGTNAGGSSNSDNNVFVGASAGYYTTSGSSNTAFGASSGLNNATGSNNTFLGQASGASLTSGSNNVFIGSGANTTLGSITNATVIGVNASASASNTVVLGNAATTITGSGLAAGTSGLRFASLNSSSATTATSGSTKVLSVDGSGNVILVALAGATTTSVNGPVAESTWKNQDGYLYNNSTNGVVINGTGLDGNALIVKGGVLSKEVNVKVEGAESWPDYVFKPSYKRMSLEEVEKFISINGHLPNVASANEMAATGNNLNKTDIKLLEKVEELTLYLLEMKKANDAQSTEIQSLKNQMNKLKKNRK